MAKRKSSIDQQRDHLPDVSKKLRKTTQDHNFSSSSFELQHQKTKESEKLTVNYGSPEVKVKDIAPISIICHPDCLTAWTKSTIPKSLPKLPKIDDPILETATFTHAGLISSSHPTSYERLEWIGDAYLYLISTLLISKTFTTHTPGKCAQIRELLVKNETLAAYAQQYGFADRARLPEEYGRKAAPGGRLVTDRERVKVFGDIFEAYVAAVILSDPSRGVDRVSAWLKDLWATTIADKIEAEESRTRGIQKGTVNLRPKELLARMLVSKGIKLDYKDAGPITYESGTNHALYEVGIYLNGWGEHGKLLATGRGISKKEAGQSAAETAIASKMLDVYVEKKRVFDELYKAEKEAAALGKSDP